MRRSCEAAVRHDDIIISVVVVSCHHYDHHHLLAIVVHPSLHSCHIPWPFWRKPLRMSPPSILPLSSIRGNHDCCSHVDAVRGHLASTSSANSKAATGCVPLLCACSSVVAKSVATSCTRCVSRSGCRQCRLQRTLVDFVPGSPRLGCTSVPGPRLE